MSDFDDLKKRMEQGKGNSPFVPSHFAGQQKSNQHQQYQQKNSTPPKSDDLDIDWEHVLKRVSLFMGVFIAIISIYFSYDGFDNSVTGGNVNYKWYAKMIGITLATAVTIMQFVFSSSFDKLNPSLKLFGLASYAYSMWSNYQGITHTLQMDKTMAIVATLFMDGVPEPLIAWALGASLRGDFVGNTLKSVGGMFKSFFYKPKNIQSRTYQNKD